MSTEKSGNETRSPNYLYLGLAILTLSVLPYFYAAYYSFPSTDDFNYAVTVKNHGILTAQLLNYQSWSGRYTANFLLSFNPVAQNWIWGFCIIPLFFLSGLLFSLWKLFKSFVNFFNLNECISPLYIYLSALAFFSLYLSHLQIPVEGIYWLAGSVTYTFPVVLALICITWVLKLFKEPYLSLYSWMGLNLFSFLIVGCNETIMLQWNFFLLIIQIFYQKKWTKLSRQLGITQGLVLSGTVIVILAPGNSVRSSHFPDSHRIFYALYRTVGACVEHFFQFLNVPLLFYSLILGAWVVQHRNYFIQNPFFKTLSVKFILIFFSLMMFTAFFPALWAMGGNPPKRVDDTTLLWFLIFWFIFLFTTLIKNVNHLHPYVEKLLHYVSAKNNIFLVLCIISLFTWKNHREAFISLPLYSSYNREWYERMNRTTLSTKRHINTSSKNNSSDSEVDLEFEKIKFKPKILFHEDLTTDPNNWINQGWSHYFGVHSVKIK